METRPTTGVAGCSVADSILQQAQGATPSEAAKLVEKVVESAGIYVFGELLDLPSIQQLAEGEFKKHYDLLKLFAYGTYKDFKANEASFPALTEGMIRKMRHLTVATLASRDRSLHYPDLMASLDLANRRQLEDLIIEAIYADVVRGKLDQRNSRFEVEHSLPRDVPGDLTAAVRLLEDWCASCESVLATIEKEADRADRNRAAFQERCANLEGKIQAKKQLVDEVMLSDEAKSRPKVK